MATKRNKASVGDERAKKIAAMLLLVQDYTDRLSDWELGFIENIDDQFTNRGTLTDPQYENLERIYNRFS